MEGGVDVDSVYAAQEGQIATSMWYLPAFHWNVWRSLFQGRLRLSRKVYLCVAFLLRELLFICAASSCAIVRPGFGIARAKTIRIILSLSELLNVVLWYRLNVITCYITPINTNISSIHYTWISFRDSLVYPRKWTFTTFPRLLPKLTSLSQNFFTHPRVEPGISQFEV